MKREELFAPIREKYDKIKKALKGTDIGKIIEKDRAAGADILHRSSFNFDLGLYDTDTNTLYFCKLDT